MSSLFLTEETLEDDAEYQIRSYRYLFGSCGYFYIIVIRKVGETSDKQMVVRDGGLFGYLENVRLLKNKNEIKFKKTNINLSNDFGADHIVITGHNDYITLEE